MFYDFSIVLEITNNKFRDLKVLVVFNDQIQVMKKRFLNQIEYKISLLCQHFFHPANNIFPVFLMSSMSIMSFSSTLIVSRTLEICFSVLVYCI